MVTIKDMAEILGISTTTVSNVIHGKTNQVSQKTVERVEKLLEEYEYVPNTFIMWRLPTMCTQPESGCVDLSEWRR